MTIQYQRSNSNFSKFNQPSFVTLSFFNKNIKYLDKMSNWIYEEWMWIIEKSKAIEFKICIFINSWSGKNSNRILIREHKVPLQTFAKNVLSVHIAKLTFVRLLDLPQKFPILHHIFYLIIVLCIHASSFVWNKNMNGIFLCGLCLHLEHPWGKKMKAYAKNYIDSRLI